VISSSLRDFEREPIHVTVAICTFNRAGLLDDTLDSLARLRIPDGLSWEVIVVNNNSTDDTDAVVDRHAKRLPVRCVLERVSGKSQAANRAVAEARGSLILWTDDDVIVDEGWLEEYVRVSRARPDAAYFGGTVDPWFETPAPAWIEANICMLNEPYALAQHGSEVFPLVDQAIVGANMATRLAVARTFPFNVRLGPNGDRALRGEDTELVGRLRAAGLPGVWVGSARVRHRITADRLTTDYLWHWYGGLGNFVAQHSGIATDVPLVFGAPRWAIKRYATLWLKYWLLYPFKRRAWFQTLREAALMQTYLAEARRAVTIRREETTSRLRSGSR